LYLGEFAYAVDTNERTIYDGMDAQWGGDLNVRLWYLSLKTSIIGGRGKLSKEFVIIPDAQIAVTVPMFKHYTVRMMFYASLFTNDDISMMYTQ